ncbi:Ig-like domain-containing protein [Rhodococcus marinonascens]|uniref:Ig-like domain-containing protein n=1 Tax=Rhodococcus marinonascens TaxID=38311 RepID=UPI0009329573|nr:Ig-like domain-containing protein [Rhodococcus marinonascens]
MATRIGTPGGRERLTAVFGGAILSMSLAVFGAQAAAHADSEDLQISAYDAPPGDTSAVPPFEGDLAPGQEITQTWDLRNKSNQGGFVKVYLGEWKATSPDMKVYVRAQIGDDFGDNVDLVEGAAEPGTELASAYQGAGQDAKLVLVVGMPIDADNLSPEEFVDPDFRVDLVPDADAAATTTTLDGPNDATTGEPVDLSAEVKGPEVDFIGGTVQFKDNGEDIGDPVQPVDGRATLPHTFTADGEHEITAVYSGADGFEGSTGQAETVTVTAPNNSGTGSFGSLGSLGSIFGS